MSWCSIPLSSAFDFIRNGMSVKQDSGSGGLPITRIETISNGNINPAKVGFAGLGYPEATKWMLKEGDILFSHINSFEHVGKCAVYRGEPAELVHGMNLLCLRADRTKLNPEYAKHLLRTAGFRSQLERFINKAVNQASVSIGNLSGIPILLPSLEEQRRIAAILDQAEELRAKRRAAIALLDQLPQAIFLEMFGDPFSNPRSWLTKELRSVTSAIIDCPHSTPIWTSDGATCLRTSNLGKGSWEWTDHRYVSEETYLLRSSRGEIEPGDIILSREGTVGIMAIAPEGHRMCMGQRLVQVKPRAEMVTAQFLMNYLLFLLSPERLKQSMVGSTAQHLNVKELRSLNCLVPPLELQHQFSARIEAVRCTKVAQQLSLAKLNVLFAALQELSFRDSSFQNRETNHD